MAQIRVDLSSRVIGGFAGIEPTTSGQSRARTNSASFTSSRITIMLQACEVACANIIMSQSMGVIRLKLAGKMAKMHFCYG